MNTESINKKLKKAAIALAVILAVVSVFTVGFAIDKKSDVKKAQLKALNLPEGFTITSHAGALDTEPNSADSLAVLLGYAQTDCIEVDVRFNENGEPVLSHNKVKQGGEYMTLEELFSWLPAYSARVNLDLKEFSGLDEISRLAKEYGVEEQVFFTGVDKEAAAAVKEQCPNIKYYINIFPNKIKLGDREYLDALADEIVSLGGIGINLNYRFVSEELVMAMHEKGLLVSVWTVDRVDDMYLTLADAPDNITTRNPLLLWKIINKE